MIDSNNKVNVITPSFVSNLDLSIKKLYAKAQKIDSFLLKTYEIVTVIFLIKDMLKKILFFEKTFLLATTSIEIVLEIFFLLIIMLI